MKKFLNYNFLMTVLASVIVLLEILVEVFKIKINIEAVISISVAVIGLMVTAGIVNKTSKDKTIKTKDDLKELYDDLTSQSENANEEIVETSEKTEIDSAKEENGEENVLSENKTMIKIEENDFDTKQ